MAGKKNPTYAERLAAVVEGRGSMNYMAAAKQLSFVCPWKLWFVLMRFRSLPECLAIP